MVGCEVDRPLWVVLGSSVGLGGRSWEGIGPKSGPNPSGKPISRGLSGRKSGPNLSGKAISRGFGEASEETLRIAQGS